MLRMFLFVFFVAFFIACHKPSEMRKPQYPYCYIFDGKNGNIHKIYGEEYKNLVSQLEVLTRNFKNKSPHPSGLAAPEITIRIYKNEKEFEYIGFYLTDTVGMSYKDPYKIAPLTKEESEICENLINKIRNYSKK